MAEFFSKLFISLPNLKGFKDNRDIFCLHGVSAGELSSFYTFASLLRGRYRLLITTSTRSGMEMAKKLYSGDLLIYFPYDFPFSVIRFFNFFKPKVICFAEGEFWPFMLWYADRQKIPSFLINGRISSKDLSRYSLLKAVFRKVFSYHSLLFLQSLDDYDRFSDFGINSKKLCIVGNLKFDLSMEFNQPSYFFDKDRLIIVLASSHRGEEEIILDVFSRLRELFPNITLIIAPRHPEDRVRELSTIISSYSFNTVLFSNVRDRFGDFSFSDRDILVIDTIGDLLSLYKYSDIVILGGSFVDGVGGHNPIEPAYFGKPIIMGSFYYNISSIVRDLSFAGAIILCCDGLSDREFSACIRKELSLNLKHLISDVSFRERMGSNASSVVNMSRGASVKTSLMVKQYLYKVL